MYQFIKNITELYRSSHHYQAVTQETKLGSVLDDTLAMIQKSFAGSADLTIREISLSAHSAAIITIDNMIDKQVLAESILNPLMTNCYLSDAEHCYQTIKYKVLCTAELVELNTLEEIESSIMSGFAVIAVNGISSVLAVGIQGYASRSVSEPESDIVQRGAKEGFVESVRVNMTMMRRRLKTHRLKFETMTIGQTSHTQIVLGYLTDVVSPEILQELKKRLHSVPLDTVLTAGYLVPFLEDRHEASVFSGTGISERPDTVCGKLTEGRIAVLVDGVPAALIVPYIFAEHFQSLDDYSNRSYFATFTRSLKYIAFFISVLLPGLFVSLGTFNPELFPALMLNKIASSIAATPLSLPAETVVILFIYEIMREAGLRMPQPLGYAVSIVGGLVIGDTAVNAGLIGAPTLMVVAISAIASYVVPDLYAPSAVLRLLFTLSGGLLGIWGIAVLFSIVMINLCSKTSFGIPYMSPITPASSVLFRDVAVRADWKILSRQKEKIQDLPGAATKEREDQYSSP